MILPTKHLSQERALLSVGARLLAHLSRVMTVSSLWEEASRPAQGVDRGIVPLKYDAFVLTLDLLFLMGAIDLEEGLLRRNAP
jgi:ABC-3C biological conflict system middle component